MAPVATKATKGLRKRSTKAEHGTSVGIAVERIRDLIVHAKLAPGTWIVEGDLCEHLNMSRTPVRGALYLLLREGYVIEYRNASKSRMIVAPLTKEDANELYPIIGRLEGLSGRRAGPRPSWSGHLRPGPRISQVAADGRVGTKIDRTTPRH